MDSNVEQCQCNNSVLCDVSTDVYTALLSGSSGCILHWHSSASASDVPHAPDLWLLQLLSRIFIIVTTI